VIGTDALVEIDLIAEQFVLRLADAHHGCCG
jgi:hypothetical protein